MMGSMDSTCAVAGSGLPEVDASGASEPATSPSANTRGWSFTRSVGSVRTAPRSVAGKGNFGVFSLTPSFDTGLLPAVHSTRSACSSCMGRSKFFGQPKAASITRHMAQEPARILPAAGAGLACLHRGQQELVHARQPCSFDAGLEKLMVGAMAGVG